MAVNYRYSIELTGSGETSIPAPDYQGRDRQLQGRICEDDGIRRKDNCG